MNKLASPKSARNDRRRKGQAVTLWQMFKQRARRASGRLGSIKHYKTGKRDHRLAGPIAGSLSRARYLTSGLALSATTCQRCQTILSRLYEQSQPHRNPRLGGPPKTTIDWVQAEADTNTHNNWFPIPKPRRSTPCQAMIRRVFNALSSRFAVTATRRSSNMGH